VEPTDEHLSAITSPRELLGRGRRGPPGRRDGGPAARAAGITCWPPWAGPGTPAKHCGARPRTDPAGCSWNCSPANGPAGPVRSSTRFPSLGRPPAGAGLGTRPAEALLIKPARPKMRFFIDPGTPKPREQDPSASYRYVSASCVAAELPDARARVQQAGRLPRQCPPTPWRSATIRRAGNSGFYLKSG
jgi:hypothetical protein